MVVDIITKNKFLSKLVFKLGNGRAQLMFDEVRPYLKQASRVIDIGTGTGNISKILSNNNFKVVSLDIADISMDEDVKVLIYDGKTIPFKNNHFDCSLLLSVMHHTQSPEQLLQEATRVAKEVIVIEDIYTNYFNKKATHFFDSLFNLEFKNHPHSNKKDEDWKEVFKKNHLKLVNVRYFRSFLVFKHAAYHLVRV